MTGPVLFTVPEVAREAHCSVSAVRAAIRSGPLVSFRYRGARDLFVEADALVDFLAHRLAAYEARRR